jgi:hypothetical protein
MQRSVCSRRDAHGHSARIVKALPQDIDARGRAPFSGLGQTVDGFKKTAALHSHGRATLNDALTRFLPARWMPVL